MELGIEVRRTRPTGNVTFASTETESLIILIAHLPGFQKDEIEILLDESGTRLIISGKGRRTSLEAVIMRRLNITREVEIDRFCKFFQIPNNVNIECIDANFYEEEATLVIFLPKLIGGEDYRTIIEEIEAEASIEKEEETCEPEKPGTEEFIVEQSGDSEPDSLEPGQTPEQPDNQGVAVGELPNNTLEVVFETDQSPQELEGQVQQKPKGVVGQEMERELEEQKDVQKPETPTVKTPDPIIKEPEEQKDMQVSETPVKTSDPVQKEPEEQKDMQEPDTPTVKTPDTPTVKTPDPVQKEPEEQKDMQEPETPTVKTPDLVQKSFEILPELPKPDEQDLELELQSEPEEGQELQKPETPELPKSDQQDLEQESQRELEEQQDVQEPGTPAAKTPDPPQQGRDIFPVIPKPDHGELEQELPREPEEQQEVPEYEVPKPNEQQEVQECEVPTAKTLDAAQGAEEPMPESPDTDQRGLEKDEQREPEDHEIATADAPCEPTSTVPDQRDLEQEVLTELHPPESLPPLLGPRAIEDVPESVLDRQETQEQIKAEPEEQLAQGLKVPFSNAPELAPKITDIRPESPQEQEEQKRDRHAEETPNEEPTSPHYIEEQGNESESPTRSGLDQGTRGGSGGGDDGPSSKNRKRFWGNSSLPLHSFSLIAGSAFLFSLLVLIFHLDRKAMRSSGVP